MRGAVIGATAGLLVTSVFVLLMHVDERAALALYVFGGVGALSALAGAALLGGEE